jgi:type I restriction enzyme S subunit
MAKVSSWQEKEIRRIGEVITGTTPSTKKPEYYGDEYKLISPADLDRGKYVTTAHRMLSKLGLERCRVLPRDAVLVGCIGNVGKIGMVADERAATNQQINAVICNQEHDPEFIYYSLCYNRQRLEKAAVKTTVPILNKSNFGKFKIDVPSLPEQRRIARVLSTAQTAIEQQSRLIVLTQELKRSLMHKLFTEGLRGERQKMTEIGPVPESWGVVALGSVSQKPQYGYTATAQETGSAKFLRITDIRGFGVDWVGVPFCECPADLIEKYKLEKDDLVFARIGATTGKSFVVKDLAETETVFASYLIRVRPNRDRLDSQFLGYFCQTEGYWKQVDSQKGSNLKGGINASVLRRLSVPLPEIGVQEEIAATISKLDDKINLTQERVLLLEELFRTLLHQLMTGQIRVNGINLPESLAEMTYA